jgi:alanine dehydrogenase
MSIGIPAEMFEMEKRVAMTPSQIPKFRRMGFSIHVESGAGLNAGFRDSDYERYGGNIVSKPDAWSCDIVLKIRRVLPPEIHFLHRTKLLVSYV